jgi:hypothetical protein
MRINFDTTHIENFLNDSSQKYVVTLNENSLRLVPLRQTSIFHRIAAWFGCGPLNLNNIANFISHYNEEINQKLTPANQILFYQKLIGKCLHYNSNYIHAFSYVPNSVLSAFEKHVPMCSDAFFSKETTYHSREDGLDGNVDFSYSNRRLGFGYVVDGAGHNNPYMQPVLQELLRKFTQSYEQALESRKFKTIESAQQFLTDQLGQLARTLTSDSRPIHKNSHTFEDLSYHPAISFAQTIRIGSSYYLLSVELADTMIVIKKANGTFDTSLATSRPDFGLGSGTINVHITPISPGDTIIGFSDGIGEYLTLEECTEIISSSMPSNLLENFKDKIIDKGKEFTKRVSDTSMRREEDIQSANQSRYIKYHTFDVASPRYHDDISLFALTV